MTRHFLLSSGSYQTSRFFGSCMNNLSSCAEFPSIIPQARKNPGFATDIISTYHWQRSLPMYMHTYVLDQKKSQNQARHRVICPHIECRPWEAKYRTNTTHHYQAKAPDLFPIPTSLHWSTRYNKYEHMSRGRPRGTDRAIIYLSQLSTYLSTSSTIVTSPSITHNLCVVIVVPHTMPFFTHAWDTIAVLVVIYKPPSSKFSQLELACVSNSESRFSGEAARNFSYSLGQVSF